MLQKSSWLNNTVVSVFVFLLLMTTVLVFFKSKEADRREQSIILTSAVDNISQDLQANLNDYISTLTTVGQFILASGEVSFKEFELFTREFLDLYPGIHGLSWNKRVLKAELTAFEKSVRAEGFSHFQIYQRVGLGETEPVTPREVYFPVTYSAPFETNKKAHGYDTYSPDKVSENVRLKTLDKARDEMLPLMTGRISLVQLENQYGLLIYNPVYTAELSDDTVNSRRHHLRGYTAGIFVVPEVLRSTAQQAELSGLALTVRDISMPEGSRFLYDSRTEDNKEYDNSQDANEGLFRESKTFDVAGHTWEIDFLQVKETILPQPWTVLIVGVSATLLLGVVLMMVLTRAGWFSSSSLSSKDRTPSFSVIVVVVVGVLLSLATAMVFKNLEQKEKDNLMAVNAKSHSLAAQNGVSRYLYLTDSIASYLNNAERIDAEAFRAFVSPLLQKYPGVKSVKWAPRITSDNRSEFESSESGDSLGKLGVTEYVNEKKVSAASRTEYFPVLFEESSSSGESALGVDLGSNLRIQHVLSLSRNSGKTLASEDVSLFEAKSEPGEIWVFSPVYSEVSRYNSAEERRIHFEGFVVLVLQLEDVIAEALGRNYDHTFVQIEDISSPGDFKKIFSTFPTATTDLSGIEFSELFEFAGRQWKVSIAPRIDSYESENTLLPWLVLGAGFFTTGLVSLILLQLSRRHIVVENLVELRTSELRENQAFGKLVISTIPDLVFVMDKNLQLIDANPAFLELWPTDTPAQGTNALKKIGFRYNAEFNKNNQTAFLAESSEDFEKVVFADEEIHTLVTKRVRFLDSNGDAFVLGVARDVTDREEVLRQLTRSNEELDEFAYIASHDLKEPLRGISNHAAMFKRNNTSLDADSARRLNRIVDLTKYMEALINDLLYFSRVGRTDIAIQETDLHTLVTEVVHSIEMANGEMPNDKCVKVMIAEDLPTLSCDRIRLGEVFRNLIINGLKYNESAEKIIRIGVELQEVDDRSQAVIFVSDNGIGIDEEFHAEIFRIFKRLHKKSAYGGGTGSGLTFVKKIIDRHGGRIWLTSKRGEGTTFYFVLPKAQV